MNSEWKGLCARQQVSVDTLRWRTSAALFFHHHMVDLTLGHETQSLWWVEEMPLKFALEFYLLSIRAERKVAALIFVQTSLTLALEGVMVHSSRVRPGADVPWQMRTGSFATSAQSCRKGKGHFEETAFCQFERCALLTFRRATRARLNRRSPVVTCSYSVRSSSGYHPTHCRERQSLDARWCKNKRAPALIVGLCTSSV